ncbi:hypothetical protein HK099_003785 [Clydaea vesicula]|uniref:PKD/REJ-like domain-containing protein n=1 Tax=Clydaea vesicula TaxID=447962 RepID=A0AAD5U180_9FUNG|nr:hypothetical protein HK099_003785 [Clydaea vesicula]
MISHFYEHLMCAIYLIKSLYVEAAPLLITGIAMVGVLIATLLLKETAVVTAQLKEQERHMIYVVFVEGIVPLAWTAKESLLNISKINGTKIMDTCGLCDGDGTSCAIKLTAVYPAIIPNSQSAVIRLYGSNFTGEAMAVYINETIVSKTLVTVLSPQLLSVTISEMYLIDKDPVKLFISVSQNNVIQTNILEIKVYRPATVDLYHPTIYTSNSSNTLTLYGNNFLIGETGYCLYETNPIQFTKLNTITETVAECPSIIYPKTGSVIVRAFYGEKNGITINSDIFFTSKFVLELKYYEKSPILLSSTFVDPGNSIKLLFDAPITAVQSNKTGILNSETNYCLNYFESTFEGKLWRPKFEMDCTAYFISKTIFNIKINSFVSLFLPKMQITAGSRLNFTKNRIFRLGSVTQFKRSFEEEWIVKAPDTVSFQYLNLMAPSSVGNCDDLTFDLTSVGNAGGHTFTSASINFTSSVFENTDSTLNAFLSILSTKFVNGSRFLSIPYNMLSEKTYNFQFTAQHMFGHISETKVVKKFNRINFPQIYIKALNSLVDFSTYNVYSAVISQQCESFAPVLVILQWNITSVDGTHAPYIEYSNDTNLIISPFTLKENLHYTITLTAGYVGFPPVISQYTILTKNPSLLVDAKGSKTVGIQNDLTFTAEYKFIGTHASETFLFQWYCFTTDLNPCVDLTSSNNSLLFIPAGLVIKLNRKLFINDFIFYFVAKSVSTKLTAVSDPAYITITSGHLPIFRLIFSAKLVVPNDDSFFIAPEVDINSVTSKVNKLIYKYEMLSTCEGKYFNTIDVSDPTFVKTPNSPILTFQKSALKSGDSYCIKLSVTDPGNSQVGSSYGIFSVLENPQGGFCKLDSSSVGIEFLTVFTFQCLYWVTDPLAYPLRYLWEIKNSNNDSDFYKLTTASTSSQFSSTFPAGRYTVKVTILDKLGSANSVEQLMNVTVTESKLLQSNLKESINVNSSDFNFLKAYFEQIATDFTFKRNIDIFLGNLSLISNIPLLFTPNLTSDLGSLLISNLTSVIRNTNLHADVHTTNFIIDILYKMSHFALKQMNSVDMDGIFESLFYIVQRFKLIFQYSIDVVKKDFILRVITILDNISATSLISDIQLSKFQQTNEIRDLISTFYSKSLPGGAEILSVNGTSTNINIGQVNLVDLYTLQMGNFFVVEANMDFLYEVYCIKFFSGLVTSKFKLNYEILDGVLDLNSYIYDLKFSFSNLTEINGKAITKIKIHIDVDFSFAKRNSITSQFNLNSNETNLYCFWSQADMKVWSKEGCELTYVSSKKAICNCRYQGTHWALGIYKSNKNSTILPIQDNSETSNLPTIMIILIILLLISLLLILFYFCWKNKIKLKTFFNNIWTFLSEKIIYPGCFTKKKKKEKQIYPTDNNWNVNYSSQPEKESPLLIWGDGADDVSEIRIDLEESPEDELNADFQVYSFEEKEDDLEAIITDINWPIEV